jgi:L-amino acid N-acyltransferase YncA
LPGRGHFALWNCVSIRFFALSHFRTENRYPLFLKMLYPACFMTVIAIRAAGPDDIPAITRIYAHAVCYGAASFELEPPDEAEMARRQRALIDGGFPYLVAELDGALAGYAYAGPYRARPAYDWTLEDSIYIAEAAQRRGIGRALLERLLADSTARGFRQMIAVIGDSANLPSTALHRAAGFTMVGTFTDVGFKFGRWLDIVLMQRALGPGATTPP